MSSSIFKPLHSQNHLQRNVFDLSNRSLFTARCGMLLPVFVRETNPNEKFTIRPDVFTRTQPLNTAAFSRVKQNLDFFFVPYRVLWHNFGNFYTQTEYKSRGFTYYGKSFDSVPLVRQYTEIWNDTKSGTTDTFGYDMKFGARRLFDMLGYGNPKNESDQQIEFAVSPFRLCAYQKIYQDFYRNPLYEPMNAECYSLDNFTPNQEIWPDSYPEMFKIRYANWKKDYFTNNRPMFAGADFMSSASLNAPNFINNRFSTLATAQQNPNDGKDNQAFIYQSIESHNNVSFTINDIRSAYALDKLLKLRERAKDGSYTEQVNARFGVTPSDDMDSSTYLGSVDSPISIGEVVSSADTYDAESGTGDSLGRIAGKGYSNARGQIEYESKEHGIIMGILSFVPEAEYDCTGVSRFNTMVSAFDYYQPEFDDLGYQPTFAYELDNTKEITPTAATILGYNPRYAHYKTAFDEVHGAFCADRDLSAWVAQRVPSDQQDTYKNGLALKFFKVHPQILDSIFAIHPTDDSSDPLSSSWDTFLCSADFQVTAIRPMSVYGLPNV